MICSLQKQNVWGKQTSLSFSVSHVLQHLFPDQSIQSHSEASLSLYSICPNRAPGEVALLPPGTHTHIQILPSVLKVVLDR